MITPIESNFNKHSLQNATTPRFIIVRMPTQHRLFIEQKHSIESIKTHNVQFQTSHKYFCKTPGKTTNFAKRTSMKRFPIKKFTIEPNGICNNNA